MLVITRGYFFYNVPWLFFSKRIIFLDPINGAKVKYTLTELVAEATNIEHMEEDARFFHQTSAGNQLLSGRKTSKDELSNVGICL